MTNPTISEVLNAFSKEIKPIPTGPITAEEKLALIREDAKKLRALADRLTALIKEAEALPDK